MRKILLAALALLTINGSGLAQNLPSYVPANGLVGWWPFNGNANDESGNGRNGYVSGANLSTDRFGNPQNAYNFNGTNNFIGVNSLPLQSFSISSWINISAVNSQNLSGIVSNYYYAPFNGFELRIEPDSSIILVCGQTNSHVHLNAPNKLTNNIWNHIVATSDNNSIKIFINSQLVANGNIFNPLNNSPRIYFGIRDSTVSNGGGFNGKLDDIAIYNRALTQQEITALYQGGNTTANCLDLPLNLQQGLVGYWPFCGNALDESGNGNNGTVNGATLTTDRFGNAGSAYGFDGIDDNIQIPFDSSINPQRPFSVSFFGMTNTPNLSQTWLSTNPYGIIQGWDLMPFQGTGMNYEIAVNNQWNSFQTSYLYPQATWVHSSFVFDQDSIHVYLNGILFKTSFLPLGNISYGTNLPLMIGSTVTGLHWLNGKIDDIAIWNRALTQEEITQLNNLVTSSPATTAATSNSGFRFWPNPSQGNITIDAGNLTPMQGWKYKVANTLGQTVVNETAIIQQQTLIDLSTRRGNGIYYLHLINPQGHITEVKKIVLAP